MRPLELEIYTYGEEQFQAVGLEIPIPIEECEKRKMLFFNIDAISIYEEDGKKYTSIFSGGTNFLTNLDYKTVAEMICDAYGYK